MLVRRAIFQALLLAAIVGCSAPRSSAADDAASNEAVQIVDEASGVPEVHVSAPDPDSPRGQALAAMAKADAFELYSLQPWQPPADMGPAPAYGTPQYEVFEREHTAAWRRSEREWCTRTACLLRNEILGRTVVGAADIAPVRDALRLSLSQVPDYATACIAEYRHAVAFEAQGHRYQVLLCYACGQVGVVIDGKAALEADQTYQMGDEKALNAILQRAGIALAKS